ncbi:PAN domain-containing protein [Maricaulis parjimensis]|uniref:PAN domain-containing protein n=1 Tax=Maricaulis parjimensis TaxID=144023 RepID=UPI001EEF1ECB|nr:PAN domain-containing protein [Maricaulis parjimensis]
MLRILGLTALACATSAPALADDVLDGWARRGAIYQRIDMDAGTPQACAALCAGERQCEAWVWTRAELTGSYETCSLLSAALPPYRAPGQVTGLSPILSDRLDAAMERAPSARETRALQDAVDGPH